MSKSLLSTLFLAITSIAFGQINFQDLSFDEAVAKAKTENKKVFIDVYTDWCGPCKKLDANVFQRMEIGERMNPEYISIKIEAEKDDDRKSLKQYSVKAYPTMLILNGDGKLMRRIVGYRSVEQLYKELNTLLPPEQKPGFLAIKAMEDNPNDKAIWRESLATLSEENKYPEFREYAQMYVDQFDFEALNDRFDSTIFYSVTLPLDNPLIQRILAEKGNYMNWGYERYIKIEFAERAKNAQSQQEYLSIKAEAKAHYDQLYIDNYGDVESEEYFMEEVFPKNSKPDFPESDIKETKRDCADRKAARKKRRAERREGKKS